MPGIDRDRIVNKAEDELDELTCGICHDIFDDPVVTQCCRQTYCTLCINQWLVDNNTCPNDRQALDINGLSPAARMVINLLNKLMVKCSNYNNGCEIILPIEKLKDHEMNCNNCSSCKKFIEKIKEKDQAIKEKDNKIKHLEEKVKKFLGDADVNEKLEISAQDQERSQKDAIEQIRASPTPNCTAPDIFKQNMSANETRILTDITIQSIHTKSNFILILHEIKKCLDTFSEFTRFEWSIVIDFKGKALVNTLNYPIKGLTIHIGELSVVFMAYHKIMSEEEEIMNARNYLNNYEIKVNEGVSKRVFQSFIANCQNSIKSSRTFLQLAERISDKMGNIQGSWDIFVFSSYNCDCSVLCDKNVKVQFGNLTIDAYLTYDKK